jgi:hypothetical protein
MATSLLIHNTGLPFAIIVFFLFLLVSISVGWITIKIHSANLEKEALVNLQARINAEGFSAPIFQMKNEEVAKVCYTSHMF